MCKMRLIWHAFYIQPTSVLTDSVNIVLKWTQQWTLSGSCPEILHYYVITGPGYLLRVLQNAFKSCFVMTVWGAVLWRTSCSCGLTLNAAAYWLYNAVLVIYQCWVQVRWYSPAVLTPWAKWKIGKTGVCVWEEVLGWVPPLYVKACWGMPVNCVVS